MSTENIYDYCLIVLNSSMSFWGIFDSALEGKSDWTLQPHGSGKQKIAFITGDELISTKTENWKLVFKNGEEIELQKDGKWIVKIYENFDLFVTTLPYKNIKTGDLAIISVPHRHKSRVQVYDIKSNTLTYYSMKQVDVEMHRLLKEENKVKKREKAREKSMKALRKRFDSDGDDEDDIMRAIGNGSGDKFGF